MKKAAKNILYIATFAMFATLTVAFFLNLTREESGAKTMEQTGKTVYDFKVLTIDGAEKSLADYKGKTLLIVNVASKCGYTKQYAGLEKLYEKYKDKGFEILAFPCNQFGGQEPGTHEEIKEFCSLNFRVKFPMFEKINVNGDSTHPLYVYLKDQAPGAAGTKAIKWNFTKFLVDKNGKVLERYASAVTPEELDPIVEKQL